MGEGAKTQTRGIALLGVGVVLLAVLVAIVVSLAVDSLPIADLGTH